MTVPIFRSHLIFFDRCLAICMNFTDPCIRQLKYNFLVDSQNLEFPTLPRYSNHASRTSLNDTAADVNVETSSRFMPKNIIAEGEKPFLETSDFTEPSDDQSNDDSVEVYRLYNPLFKGLRQLSFKRVKGG